MTTKTDLRIALPPPAYKVEQKIVGRGHQYHVTMDDKTVIKLPGVTGILNVIAKEALIRWSGDKAAEDIGFALTARLAGLASKKITLTEEWIAGVLEEARKAPEKNKTDAANVGTLAHEYIDQFIQGKAPELAMVPKLIKPPVETFHEWFKGSNLSIVAGETMVASLAHGYGGELDVLFLDENEEFIIGDWKSSNGIYDTHALQVGGAYRQAFKETYGIDCHRAVIVRFDKTEKHYGDYNGQEAFAEWAETKNGTGFVLRLCKGKRPLIFKAFEEVSLIPNFTIIPEREKIGFEVKEVASLEHSLEGFLLSKKLQANLKLDHFVEK